VIRSLNEALSVLRNNESELRQRGVLHASIFGSVARGDAGLESDVDVLVELDPSHGLTLFQYADLREFLSDLFEGSADVANRKTLKPLLREQIISESVHAF